MHEAVISLPDNVVQMLIAVHALSVCDSARKMGAKLQVFKVPFKLGYAPVNLFGVKKLDGSMYKTTEHFLLKRMSSAGTQRRLIWLLRFSKYDTFEYKLDLHKFPCTSSPTKFQTQKAYYQCKWWIAAPILKACDLNPANYAYQLNEVGSLDPVVMTEEQLSEDFLVSRHCML